jgi:hypothetical protein
MDDPTELESGAFRLMSKKALENALAVSVAQQEIKRVLGPNGSVIEGDTPEDIYARCLELCEVDIEGIAPSAYRAMVRLLDPDGNLKNRPASALFGMDSARRRPFTDRHPNLARIRNV